MNVQIYVLKGSERLSKFEERLKEKSREAVASIEKIFPVNNVDIVLYDNPEETGSFVISGYTPNAHLIFLSLNPSAKDFMGRIKKNIERTIAHELHHAMRWRNPGYGTTLLEALVTEGLADHFADEVKKSDHDPWTHALSQKEMKKMSALAKKKYHQRYNHNVWFFGAKQKEIPFWTGYTLGYALVADYLKKHPGTKPSALVAINAKEFE